MEALLDCRDGLSLAMAATLSLAACSGEPSLLSDIPIITRAEVRRPRPDSIVMLTDSARIGALTTLIRESPRGWYKPLDTPPGGDVTVVLFHDTTQVGVVWVGSNFIAARGKGERLLHRITDTQALAWRAAITP